VLAGCLGLIPTAGFAQFGKMPSGPDFQGAAGRLFGDHSAFSATMVMSTKDGTESIKIPGKMFVDESKTRFEMDLAGMQ